MACLKIGPSSVQRIAEQADIKRVTAYVILESLITIGLVTQGVKGKKHYFVAEDPSNLNNLLEKRELELSEQRANFKQVLPELVQLKVTPKELPEVKYYDGNEGVRALFSSFFSSYRGDSTHIYAISNADQLNSFFPERGLGQANPTRVKRRIQSHLLYTSSRGAIYKDTDEIDSRTSRYIPPDKYPLSGDVSIIGDYVIMISLIGDRPMGISIRNPEMAQAMKAIFDMAWDLAEQFN